LKKDIAMYNESITDLLINQFATDKSLQEIQQDYEDLELLIARERAANGEDSRRLAALNVIAQLQLKLVLEKLVETPDKGGESTVPTKQ
jgi:hypothetical protein